MGYTLSTGLDLYGTTTLTVWACGCPLRCFFCHNWRLAEWREECVPASRLAELLRSLRDEAEAVGAEYLHITGGEPALYQRDWRILKEASGLPLSVNSSLAVPIRPESAGLADHVAFDVKIPFTIMTQTSPEQARAYARNFLANARLLAGKPAEIRVPVARGLTLRALREGEGYRKLVRELDRLFPGAVWRVQPLIHGRGGVFGRNVEACERWCNPPREEVEELAGELKELLEGGELVIYWPLEKKYEKVN